MLVFRVLLTSGQKRLPNQHWKETKRRNRQVFQQLWLGIVKKPIKRTTPTAETSRKRPLKMRWISGWLKESNRRWSFPSWGPDTYPFWKIIFCSKFQSYNMWYSSSHLKFLVSSEQRSTNSEHEDQAMRQKVTYKSLKTPQKILELSP